MTPPEACEVNGLADERPTGKRMTGTGLVKTARNRTVLGVAALCLVAACTQNEVILPGEREPIRAEEASLAPETAPADALALPAVQTTVVICRF